MTIQLHVDLRTARLQATETAIGASPKIRIYTGAQPADNVAAETGTKLAEFPLAADWLAASSGSGTINSLPALTNGLADGIAGHYRFYDTAGTKAWMQGTVSEPGGGGDAIIDIADIRTGKVVQLVSWLFVEGGA